MHKRRKTDDKVKARSKKHAVKQPANANKKITANSRKLIKAKFVGLDVHKKTISISAMTEKGTQIFNGRIPHTVDAVGKAFKNVPQGCKGSDTVVI